MSASREDITALLEKARSKLKTAHIDFENGQYDDSVSRAYYAVFHGMTAMLLSRSLSFSSHGQTIGAFNREFIKTGLIDKDYSMHIQSLFDDRQLGDYDALSVISRETAKRHLDLAGRLLETVSAYLSSA